MTSGEEKMPILGDIRRRFHRYRFEDLPSETREAVIQIRGTRSPVRIQILRKTMGEATIRIIHSPFHSMSGAKFLA